MAGKISRIKYYFRIWLLMSKNAFLVVLSQKLLFFVFLTGKTIRFIFFGAFLFFLIKGVDNLAGYSLNQTIFFFLTFNLIDVIAQFFFREVYRFRPLVVSGGFDLILTKPMNALFRVLVGGADIIDLVTIPPLIVAVIWMGGQLNPSAIHVLMFIVLIINSLMIATAFHIAIMALGIITFEIDHTIMIYRDLVNLGRFPIDIYRQPLQGVLTYLIPVGVMITLPAKTLMGLISVSGITVSLLLGIFSVFVSIRFWRFALTKYSSASS